ncbi:MAG: heme o synthase [Bacillota bacterium]
MQGSLAAPTSIGSGLGLAGRIAAYLPLLKPRIIVLLGLYGAVSALVAGGGRVASGRLLLFTVLALMAAGAAACLNHLFERKTDALMERTRNRPLPSGRVSPTAAAWLAGTLLAVSVPAAWIWLNGAVAVQLALGAAIYSGLYTLVLKRRTSWNIVIGGLAGSSMALAGWAVVEPQLSAGAWLMALLVFLWTPPHFWGLAVVRDADYRAASIPMLPQVAGVNRTARSMAGYSVALWFTSLALLPLTGLGWAYGAAALILGAVFTAGCVAFARRPTPRLAATIFKGSGAYLGLLLLAMVADLWLL